MNMGASMISRVRRTLEVSQDRKVWQMSSGGSIVGNSRKPRAAVYRTLEQRRPACLVLWRGRMEAGS